MLHNNDTIAAIATGNGGAIAIIRVSGDRAIEICDSIFKLHSNSSLAESKGYTLHYGEIVDGSRVVDDVIVSLFRAPRSYTGENMVEISCHGSKYVQQEILKLLIAAGARMAEAGEFTVRAFLAGKFDLSQAEAVADIIASSDKASHMMASNQMRGGYSGEFTALRDKLVELISLLELELDFSEEDVEFADRTQLSNIIDQVSAKIDMLIASFSLGNALKEGVSVAIVGAPNAGKSTLLNAILKDDRAMVSDIAGTTRDVIEESIVIDGIKFRFLDTAGIRHTEDRLEQMGIERTFSTMSKAQIVILMLDATQCVNQESLENYLQAQFVGLQLSDSQTLKVVINKCDLADSEVLNRVSSICNNLSDSEIITISAKGDINIGRLLKSLSSTVDASALYNGSTIVSNSRHYESLYNASQSLSRSRAGLEMGISSDLLSQDLREVLHHLGIITGEITTDDILGSIFSKFCIGK